MASYAAQLQKGVFLLKKQKLIHLSMQELSNPRTIAACGMLLALKLVLGLFTVNVSSLLKIGFSFLPIAAAGALFGPVVGGVVGAVGDVLGYFISPTGPYFPGFTLNAFLSGFLYGLVLYRKAVKPVRTVAAKVLVMLVVNMLLNPLWLMVLYGKSFFVIFSTRIATNLAMIPIDAAMLFGMLKILEKSRVAQKLQRNC